MRREGTFSDPDQPSRPYHAESNDSGTESNDPDEIRESIEHTREDMTHTIDAIQERLSPERLTEQAKDAVRDATIGRVEDAVSNVSYTARDAGNSFVDSIKQNPVPAAMAAIGLGWLWMNRQSGSTRSIKHIGPDYSSGYRSSHSPYGHTGASSTRFAGGYAGHSRDDEHGTFGQSREQAGEFVGQAREQVGEFAGQAREHVGEWSDQAQYQAQDFFRGNPLAVGAIAFGLGAAVGMAVPETEKEDQFFGEARDSVVERAHSMAQDTMHKVQSVMDETKEAAQEAAADQGLTS